RIDVHYRSPVDISIPPAVTGTPEFESEKLRALELGYRVQPNTNSSFSLSTFYNDYNDLYNLVLVGGTSYQIENAAEAETWGAEITGTYQILKEWRIRGGFTYFGKDHKAKSGNDFDPSYLSNDAKHYAMFQSMVDLPANFKFDVVGRYLDYLPATLATARVSEYFTFDTRLAWTYKNLEFSLVGQNLWSDKHVEFGTVEIQ